MIKVNGIPIRTETFPNRETKVKDFISQVKTPDCLVELKYESDQDLINLMFIKNRLDDLGKSPSLFVRYMPYSRMDRQIEGDLFTLKYVAGFIAKMGFTKVTVMEPHSSATLDLLRAQGVNANVIYPTKKWVQQIMGQDNYTNRDHVAFPDKGAQMRYHDIEQTLPNVLTFDKVRDPYTGKIQGIDLASGAVNKASKCIILDDLCSRGGTFMAVGDKLKTSGAKQVDLLVAHCEDTIFDGDLLKKDSPVDTIYTSDSLLTKLHPKIKLMEVKNEIQQIS